MDKKSIVLIVALVLVMVFYFQIMEFLGLYKPAPPIQPPAQQTTADSTIQGQPAPDQSATTIDTSVSSPAVVPSGLVAAQDSLKVDTIKVTTNEYVVTLTSFGGGPVSLLLRKYEYRKGGEIEMLPAAEYATPEARFAGGSFSTSQVYFESNLSAGNYDATGNPIELTYTFTAATGGVIKRHYKFYPNGYHYDLTLEVTGLQQLGFERQYNLVWNTPLGITEPQADKDYGAMEAVAMQGGSRANLDDFEDGKLNQTLTGTTTWAGLRSKYFAAVLIPRNREADGVSAAGTEREIMLANHSVKQRELTVGLELPFAVLGGGIADSFTVFVGPLDYTVMNEYGVGMEDMLGIGTTQYVGWMIKPFAIAIIWLLPKMYAAIPNYGLVIILFALLVKIVTMPLSLKSFKSMAAMKELQPKIEQLRKQYKDNAQALNTETMKLYKTHGVNPLSGCLPILAQMPLFFAMFSVFRQTILLRNAPFVWPITDLSRGAASLTDPYMILVIIMIAAQFVSQKFTMASATQQNKMLMYIMPLFMGFIFWNFEAGLVLYWTCFSVFSVLDYVAFKRNKNAEVKTA